MMNTLCAFSKMHGLGNDFVVIDAVSQSLNLNGHIVRRLADRHTGIGCDQCLILEPSPDKEHDFFYRIFNADGSEVGQCGNGARCLAMFIKQKALCEHKEYRIKTSTTSLLLSVIDERLASVVFNPPSFDPVNIPLKANKQADYYEINVGEEALYLHALNVGNPHGIIITDKIPARSIIERLGYTLSTHSSFEQGANISWVTVHSPGEISIETYERGCGPTMACGSAAAAAASCVRAFHHGAKTINVNMPGGAMSIQWPGIDQPLTAIGPAVTVFEGHIRL